MARKVFHYVALEPPIWDPGQPGIQTPVLSAEVPAPDGANRRVLRSRLYRRPTDPHEAFFAFNGIHDGHRTVEVYASADGDETVERLIVFKVEFSLYELRRAPGTAYFSGSEERIKSLFKRHRDQHGRGDMTYSGRIVRIADLEETLHEAQHSDVVGYSLANVNSVTPLDRMDVLGQNLRANPEIQDHRRRAGTIRLLVVDLQRHGQLLRIGIREDGTVIFYDYPGDNIALGIIDVLERHIDGNSDRRSINLR